jgi:hypothetical protein
MPFSGTSSSKKTRQKAISAATSKDRTQYLSRAVAKSVKTLELLQETHGIERGGAPNPDDGTVIVEQVGLMLAAERRRYESDPEFRTIGPSNSLCLCTLIDIRGSVG